MVTPLYTQEGQGSEKPCTVFSIPLSVRKSRPDSYPCVAEAQAVSSLPIGHLSHSCLNKGLILTSHPRVGTRALVSEFMKLHPFEVFRHSRVSLSVGPSRRRDAFSMSSQ